MALFKSRYESEALVIFQPTLEWLKPVDLVRGCTRAHGWPSATLEDTWLVFIIIIPFLKDTTFPHLFGILPSLLSALGESLSGERTTFPGADK